MLVHGGQRLEAEPLGDLLEARRVALVLDVLLQIRRESRSGAWSGAQHPPRSRCDRIEPELLYPKTGRRTRCPLPSSRFSSADPERPARAPRLGARRSSGRRPRWRSPPAFAAALRGARVAVIAEVKRRSPSAGSIREDLDPADHAARYARHGAAAISVLTDGPFFGGSLDDLRAAAGRSPVPVLRKDFILDELQIVEARAAGAAAVLLIVRALSQARLVALLASARDAGLDALVEVHTPDEVGRRPERGRRDPRRQQPGSRHLPDRHRRGLADPGARCPPTASPWRRAAWRAVADVEAAAAAGADAVLIGTALSAAAAPGASAGRAHRACPAVADSEPPVRAKICGLTRPEDAVDRGARRRVLSGRRSC